MKMTDEEKFAGFKEALIEKNEKQYGAELRERYGNAEIDESNAHLKGMSQTKYDEAERILLTFEETLAEAFKIGDPASETAQKACALHKQWLSIYYPKYSKAYHKGLADMYVADERFRANYDKIAVGCTDFLRDAIYVFCA